MTEVLFTQAVPVQVKSKDCEERRVNVRVHIELQSALNPIHRKDLIVQLTDDTDPFFLFHLVISEEDFQSLKCQQGLLVDFSAFPQRFIELLQHCIQEQSKDIPRFLLQLVSPASVLDHTPAFLNVIETNPFKHLTHLSLKLLPGNDAEIKKYLAACLKCVKEEKFLLEQKLKKTEDDLGRQLSYTQQTLSEKSRELDRLRSDWTAQATALTNKHSQELTSEKEKVLQTQTQYQQQYDQQRKEMESLHQRNLQQLQSRLTELELVNKDLTERRYKADCTIRELKSKLLGLEDECQRAKQEVLSLRRENSTLDAECHEKEKLINQLQTRVAVVEQEVKDKEQLVFRTKEVLTATQEQKVTLEESAEKKQDQIGKLEATIKSLSAELLKANEIIKKLQGDLKTLMGKLKLKNTVTVQQEKLLSEKEERLNKEQQELQDVKRLHQLKVEEVCKLQEQLDATIQKLEESKQLLKTNENVITWLNKQLNETQSTKKPEVQGMFGNSLLHTNGVPFRLGPLPTVPENRFFYPTSGTKCLAPSAITFKGSLPQMVSSNQQSLAAHAQESGPKVQLNAQFPKSNAVPADVQPPGLSAAANKENGEPMGLELKYFKKREDSIPLRGLNQNVLNNPDHQKPSAVPVLQQTSSRLGVSSAYFPGLQTTFS
ncbi:spindle assembly abnormal protein 6 homolog isoform X1 [Microcaecilia unicolor]|uniref:Spindle assembly abnormal protein 6 homolog n=1 Tax=Microcaecilia unicolor TaxID=1415580 RepID=A0A6P7YET5_9AMPH|nr:spindle assembly abnormal protein 6 homolog isoform X1 [Microcaecilia unicolor]